MFIPTPSDLAQLRTLVGERTRSVAIRAAYAFGEWPPACDDETCLRPDRHVKHIEDVDAAEAAPRIQESAA